jgi:hypothetical protein
MQEIGGFSGIFLEFGNPTVISCDALSIHCDLVRRSIRRPDFVAIAPSARP